MMQRRQWLAALGGLVLAAAVIILLLWLSGAFALRDESQPIHPFADSPQLVIGEIKTDPQTGTISISADQQNHALIIADTQLEADAFPVLRYDLDRSDAIEVVFAWRLAESPEKNHSITLPEHTFATRLNGNPDWHGTVTEVAIALRPIPGASPAKTQAGITGYFSLLPASAYALTQALISNWLALPGWAGISINHLGFTWLPAVLVFWSALGSGLAWLLTRKSRSRTALCAAIAGFFISWLVLEALWLRQLYAQHHDTQSRFTGSSFKQRLTQGYDSDLVEFSLQTVKELAAINSTGRVYFLTPERYFAERGRYFMLPHEVVHLHNIDQLEQALAFIEPGDALAISLTEAAEVKAFLREQHVAFQVVATSKYRELMVIYPDSQKQR